ncbi:MAG: zinc ribbon domain-containing protein [Candidatus Eremiobacteraeota bacterium]|nr:zinc ribbon domain-containing protein [Candidatus Eremiobacteraeota bacterium]
MLCVKCGHNSASGARYCEKCNAVMIQAAPETTTTSAIDVEEGMEYLSPERNYECQWLADFVDSISRYTNGEVEIDEVKRVYQNIKKIYESFDNKELPDFLNELDGWRNTELGKEYSRQMTYLLTKGFQLMGEGMEIIRTCLDNPEQTATMQDGLEKLQDGVNQIGLAEEFLGIHQQIMEEEIARRQMESRAEEFQARIDSKKPAQEEAEA